MCDANVGKEWSNRVPFSRGAELDVWLYVENVDVQLRLFYCFVNFRQCFNLPEMEKSVKKPPETRGREAVCLCTMW